MKDRYPYLRDPRALAEIRRHKWIESQKKGKEIGFATAAADWVKKYGRQWKKIHAEEYKDNSIFIERRKYRRFNLNAFVKLIKNNAILLTEAVNVSFFGLLCRTKERLHPGSEVNIHVVLKQNDKKKFA